MWGSGQILQGGRNMKKLLGLTLALASIACTGIAADAKTIGGSGTSVTVAANAGPQWPRRRWERRNRYRNRTVTQTRVVRVGRRLYRETYLVTYRPNGATVTRLVSRVRIS